MTYTNSATGSRYLAAIGRALSLFALIALMAIPAVLKAQTAGEGSITGTVTDSTGAAISNATVTATNTATNVATTRTTTGAGTYQIAPLPPGIYTVTVAAKGFKTLTQQNLDVVALGVLGFNPVMSLGEASETVVVTAAPPMLDTENATVGMVMENSTYSNLPLQMTTQTQRDPTAFAALAPGAQAGIRLPIIGGANNYLGQLYLDGMPAETINQQGDNRPVSLAMSVDAVDQFQVVTSTPPAEYQGAGAANFTMKSGGNKYHGQASDFIRNTAFDSWSFTNKWLNKPGINPATGVAYPACSPVAQTATVNGQSVNYAPRVGCLNKPAEHTNEMSVSVGGRVPHTAGKLFFFVAYDKFHSRYSVNPAQYTIPTTLERTGDFTELNGGIGTGGLTGTCSPGTTTTNPPCQGGDPSAGGSNPPLIFDPLSNSCVGSVCSRTPFQGLKNGIPTYNVIPAGDISAISQKMQSFMPAPNNPTVLVNNFINSLPKGFDNHATDWRLDYDVSARQRISTIGAIGKQIYLQNYSTNMPLPYTTGTTAVIFPRIFDVEDAYIINSRLTNQLKYGFTRFPQPQINATDGVAQYNPAAMGITNVVQGGASTEFPSASFGSTGSPGKSAGGVGTPMSAWGNSGAANSTQTVTPSTYSVVDNVLWVKGKHSFTFGFTYLWEQANSSAPVGYSGEIGLPYNAGATGDFCDRTKNPPVCGNSIVANTGLSYASFLIGGVSQTSIGQQPVSELGGRYREASPYAEDSWKIRPNLTLDLGIRWDYYSPYHEVKDRWTFLNPNLTNPLTGTPGLMQFAGNWGGQGVSCQCRTPVQTYWKNFGPRLGLAWQVNDKTVIRAGIATVFSAAGGVGGRGGNYNGTGQLGFNINTASSPDQTSGVTAGPSYYLSNASSYLGSRANTAINNGIAYLPNPTPGLAAQELSTGNYVTSSNTLATAQGVSLADFYISGRAPEFTFFNFGMERVVTKDMTIAVNYAGDESHFLNTGSNVRGYWANQLNPAYLVTLGGLLDSTGKNALLTSPASPANVAIAKGAIPSLNIPAFYTAAGTAFPTSSALTIAQGLVAFPQYSGVSDLWGANVGNFSYNSLQITLQQRTAHGFTFNVNYTYSKNIGDDGNFRSGFAIPAGALSNGAGGASTQSWKQDRIERSWTAASAPSVLHAFGVWQLPFGKGHMGGDNFLVRGLAGGWQLSSIYTYSAGSPMAVTSSHCSGSTNFPLQGTCMPDVIPTATNARINGSFGTGPNGTTACNLGIGPGCKAIQYVDPSKFQLPTTNGKVYLIGDAPRTAPYGLRNPGTQNLDASLRRTFPIHESLALVFEADCLNVWNKVTMSGPNTSWNNTGGANPYPAAFGTIGGISNSPRDWQFAGHINF
ncbi:MAG TPA: carboxypeptidase regulatory-like domain-containing protein [Acidobacteriaceae bacterium]|nr:carboxypeptidase regulatory-like domain-containing protein [Acidobacteriaceae bacterium]